MREDRLIRYFRYMDGFDPGDEVLIPADAPEEVHRHVDILIGGEYVELIACVPERLRV